MNLCCRFAVTTMGGVRFFSCSNAQNPYTKKISERDALGGEPESILK